MTTNAHHVQLGRTGPSVFRIGLGCMGLSGAYGRTDDEQSVRVIQHAVDRGITLVDTGDFYAMGHNERLVGRALAGRRDKVQISVKYGAMRDPSGGWVGIDTRPAATKNFAAYSLDRLGVDVIDVYRPARLDPSVPIEDTVGAVAELVAAGHVRQWASRRSARRQSVAPPPCTPSSTCGSRYAVATRGPEQAIFPALREVGASATLYGVFSRGLLTGSRPTGPGDFRAHLPRFAGEAGARNAQVVDRIAALAREADRTPAQLALGWVLDRQPDLVPLIGAKTVAHVDEALDVLDRPVPGEALDAFEQLVSGAVAGDRYAAPQMAMLDSER
ncbi:MAG: aldo/keto reductase [Myxococcota bacterium]